MKRKLIWLSLVLLAGCTAPQEQTETEILPGDTTGYEAYVHSIEQRTTADSWTAAVRSSYTYSFSDETSNIYEMDATMEAQNVREDPQAVIREHITSGGLTHAIEGMYYDGRLYNVYNGIPYYEDMTFAELKKSLLLVPSEPYALPESSIYRLETEMSDTYVTYKIDVAPEALDDLFADRYDFNEMNTNDAFQVLSGVITDVFDNDGHFISETASFITLFMYGEQEIEVTYNSSLAYLQFDQTEVVIDDEQRQQHLQYVHFTDIDTESIVTAEVKDDSEEDTVAATFRKRLINRLGYEEIDTDILQLQYNTNEAYTIDFANHTFTYSNYSINYVYNWKGDIGTMGKCTFRLADKTSSSECENSTIEMIQTVKDYLRMELYYCGLSFEDLVAE